MKWARLRNADMDGSSFTYTHVRFSSGHLELKTWNHAREEEPVELLNYSLNWAKQEVRGQWVRLPALLPASSPHRSPAPSQPAAPPPDAAPSRARRVPGTPRLFCSGAPAGRTESRPAALGLRDGPGLRRDGPAVRCAAPRPYLAQARRGAHIGSAHLACPRSNSHGRAGGSVVLMFLQLLLSTPFPIIPL